MNLRGKMTKKNEKDKLKLMQIWRGCFRDALIGSPTDMPRREMWLVSPFRSVGFAKGKLFSKLVPCPDPDQR